MFLFLQFFTLCLQYVNCCNKSFTRTHRIGRLASQGNQHKEAKSQRHRNSRGDKITLVDRKIDIQFLCLFLAIFDPIFQASSRFCYFNVIVSSYRAHSSPNRTTRSTVLSRAGWSCRSASYKPYPWKCQELRWVEMIHWWSWMTSGDIYPHDIAYEFMKPPETNCMSGFHPNHSFLRNKVPVNSSDRWKEVRFSFLNLIIEIRRSTPVQLFLKCNQMMQKRQRNHTFRF